MENGTVHPNHVCLVIVFNHKYEKNIERLEKLYRHRFQNIFYLLPFYEGEKDDVIAVYENSYCFQGYFAQALRTIYNDQYTHYVFIADDLILHHSINSKNILEILNLQTNSGYTKNITALTDISFNEWSHALPSIADFYGVCHKTSVLKFWEELPLPEIAYNLFKLHGITINLITDKNVDSHEYKYSNQICSTFIYSSLCNQIRANRAMPPPYPLAYGYSDFVVIPHKSLKKFCYYCGIFAAMNIFIEVAVPTAMLLSCENIIQERDINWFGKELWLPQECVELNDKCNKSFSQLYASFANNQLYLHPVKLSEWSD
jgi:hypothetical protein